MAACLARSTHSSLFLLRVIAPTERIAIAPLTPSVMVDHAHAEQRATVEASLKRVITYEQLDTLHTHIQVIEGVPALCIIEFAQEQHIDLIIMRSHGETGFKRALFGSVAYDVMRHSPVPVLILRDEHAPSLVAPEKIMHPPRILVALDGSPLAETVLEPAAQLSTALAAPAHGALHVTRTVQFLQATNDRTRAPIEKRNQEAKAEAATYLKNVEQRFTSGDLASYQLTLTSSVVSHTDAADIWKRVIEESNCIGDVPGYSGCDIIALATHGRQGLQHLLFGSITEQVYNETRLPLLIVHPQDASVKEPAFVD